MRKGMKFGKELILTDSEHRSLLERFDVENIKAVRNWKTDEPYQYVIKKECILCKKYFDRNTSLSIDCCHRCPFHIAFSKVIVLGKLPRACIRFIEHLCGAKFLSSIQMSVQDMAWWKSEDKIVRKGLQKIRWELLEMKVYI